MPVNAKVLYVVPAIDGLSGAAAFKNRFRFKSGSGYLPRFKELYGQKGYLIKRLYGRPNYTQSIYVLLIDGVVPVLEPEYFQRQSLKINRFNSKNFIFEFTIHSGILDANLLNLYLILNVYAKTGHIYCRIVVSVNGV